MAAGAEEEDDRETELSTISAIWPELTRDPDNSFYVTIDIPVHPSKLLPVVFSDSKSQTNDEIHYLTYLPSLQLRITLPNDYPTTSPPNFDITTSPAWLSEEKIEELKYNGRQLWEALGHEPVIYDYIYDLQQAAEDAFGLSQIKDYVQMCFELEIGLLDFDIKAKQAAFDKESFDCGVCLDPKKGLECHRMINCSHVFCRQCLQDFYNNAINEGDLSVVRCLDPSCSKQRVEAVKAAGRRKPKINLTPTELLQIPLDAKVVQRYVELKHKMALESDKNTVYCPRPWCQGAARSKKHRKPNSLLEADIDDEEAEAVEEPAAPKTEKQERADRLRICEDCGFAFCSRCFLGWHGEFQLCIPKAINEAELSDEDKASLAYMRVHTTSCPTCSVPAQKTHGCNHMICSRCETHFCYLCAAWLEPSNPYSHFNNELRYTGCFQRLWELEEGEDGDPDLAFERNLEAVHEADQEEAAPEAAPEPAINEAEAPAVVRPAAPEEPIDLAARPVVREAPLVLRIDGPPVARVRPQRQAPPPQPRRQDDDEEGDWNRINPHYAVARPGRRHLAAVEAQRAAAAARRGRGRGRGRGEGGAFGEGAAAPHPPANANANLGGRGRAARPAVNIGVIGHLVVGGRPEPRAQDPNLIEAEAAGELQAAQQEWVQRFVHLAMNDEEDQMDWDEGDNDEEWEIPMR
jgi:E3 ubiquitin-protein ligase RNF14